MTPEQQALFDDLTQLQQRTATGVLAGMSQRAAYYAAGGQASSDESADSAAHTMLSNVQVKAFMDSMKLQAVTKAVMDRQEMMERLSTLGRFGVKDIVDFKTVHVGMDMETGEEVIQTAWSLKQDIQDERLAIIESLEGGKGAPKIKTYSSIQAMALLAKIQGFESATKHEITGKDGGPILTKDVSDMSDEALMALIAGGGDDQE